MIDPHACTASVQVENMHVQRYKSLKLSAQQRELLAAFSMRWERRKRALDSNMHAARTLLAALPVSYTHLTLPTTPYV